MSILGQIVLIVLVLISPIILVVMWRRLRYNRARITWLESRDYLLLRILVPKNNEKTPLAAEQMFAALHGVYEPAALFQEHLSFEVAARDKYIQFYAYVPARLREFVEGQVYAQYPTAEIAHVDDYTSDLEIVSGPRAIAEAELELNRSEVYPIRTFQSFEVDPLSGITSVIGQVSAEEQVWIQIIMRPVADIWQTRGISHITSVKSGRLASRGIFTSIGGKAFRFTMDLLTSIVRGPSVEEEGSVGAAGEELSPVQQEGLKAVELKISKLGYAAKIRVLAIARTSPAARAKVAAVVGAFKQFNTLNLNGFQATPIKEGESALGLYRARLFEDAGFILNTEELASLYHLPSKSVEIPSIVWAGSKTGEPPSNLPLSDTVPPTELTVFAYTHFRTKRAKFGIKLRDRRYHLYAIGKTGTGKTTMLENMIIDDIKEGRGVAVVDPHGDLIAKVLRFVPRERKEDVVVFAPADTDYPIGFNILENVNPELKSIVASGVVGIFKKIFGESWGPRLEYILRNTVLALLEYPNATMLGIVRMLTNKRYRTKVIEKVKDPVIKAFFEDEFERYDPKFRTEAIAPIQNKVGQFLSSSMIRNIVGQPKSTIDVAEIMNSGKILLLDLSIGKLGEDSAALLGAMMITKVQLAAMQRAYIPEEERKDFYLYVDEFQNFATDSFATILSEARKYRLNLIMTNQFIAQMPESVASAVFGNVGTITSFRVGASDANALVKEFEPVFDANDLVNLDNYHIYVKMTVDGVTSPAFSAQTLPPRTDYEGHEDDIVRRSQESYGRSRLTVEEAILEETRLDEEPLERSRDRPLERPEPKREYTTWQTSRASSGQAPFRSTVSKGSGQAPPRESSSGQAPRAVSGQGSGPFSPQQYRYATPHKAHQERRDEPLERSRDRPLERSRRDEPHSPPQSRSQNAPSTERHPQTRLPAVKIPPLSKEREQNREYPQQSREHPAPKSDTAPRARLLPSIEQIQSPNRPTTPPKSGGGAHQAGSGQGQGRSAEQAPRQDPGQGSSSLGGSRSTGGTLVEGHSIRFGQ